MSLLEPTTLPALTPAEAQYLAATRVTGFGEYFGAKFFGGQDFSIAGRLAESLTQPGGGPLPQGVTPETAEGLVFLPKNRRITEDEWKMLRLDRPGLEFSGGGTIEYERARTDAFDERRYRDSLIARYQGGAASYTAGFAAALLGGTASPENFVPFLPQVVRTFMVARMGLIGGRAAGSAVDAALGTALADAVVLPDLASRGEDVGAADLALDVALGAVLGTAIGGTGGVLQARREAREALARLMDSGVAPEASDAIPRALAAAEQAIGGRRPAGPGLAPIVDPDTASARAVRIDGIERQADALEVAMRAVADDEPVDVGPILRDVDEDIRTRLGRNLAPSPAAQAGDRAFTATGRAINVNYEVVEADRLIASNLDNLQPNPNYPADFQPRDRSRAASADQVRSIAANLEPELLGRSATAAEGAPIVGPDYVVESGNARVLALRRALQDGGQPARRYRDFLQRQGFDVSGMQAPVLVRRRTTDLAPEERARFTVEANQRTVAAMGAGERAMADARALERRVRDFTARESVPSPHQSVVEAEAAVGQGPPKDGVDEVARLAEAMGVEDPGELADIEVMRRDGLLSAKDEAELQRADELVQDANGWATAYEIISTCVLRYGA